MESASPRALLGRLRAGFGEGRSRKEGEYSDEITWLELFYDLVYVAAVIQLGSFLSDNLTPSGVLQFVALFALLWWAWSGTAFFFNRSPVDSVPRRALLFAQTFAVGNLAIVIGGAFSGAYASFALTYAAVRLALVALYLLLYRSAPEARPLAGRLALGFGVGAALWAVSALVAPPYGYALWALAIAVDLYAGRSAETRRFGDLLPLDLSRLSERYGQFVLILLGESFIKTIGGLYGEGFGEGLSFGQLVFSAFAFVFIASVWWTYFTDVAGTVIRRGFEAAWVYAHFPLMLGIVGMGVGLQEVVLLRFGDEFAVPYRALLYGAVALCFAAVALVDATITSGDGPGKRLRILARLGAVAVLGALFVVDFRLSAFWVVSLAALACLAQIAVEVALNPRTATRLRATTEGRDAPA